jgi:hypothetical protein
MSKLRRFRDRALARVLVLILFCCSSGFAAAVQTSPNPFGDIRVSNDFSITYNSVSGDGKDRSSLSDGLHYLEILNLNGRGTLSGGYVYNWLGGLKMTDDKRNDIKNFSFTNLQFHASNGVNTFSGGDVLEYYSQYSMNSALKGVVWRYEQPNSNGIQQAGAVLGVAVPRWDSFYGGTEVKSILRRAYGGTIRGTLAPGLSAGFSFGHSIDDSSSRLSPTDSIFNGGVYAFDGVYDPFAGLNFKSELAFSRVQEGAGVGGGEIDHNGVAFKAEASGVGGPSRVTLEYERVQPQFLSLLGAATPDREKIKARWRYKYNGDMTYNFGLLWYRNDLDGAIAAGGLTATRPEAGLSLRNLFGRSTANGDILYNIDLQNGQGSSSIDHHLNLGYRDRFGNFDNNTNVGFATYQTYSNIRNNQEITFNTDLSTQYDLGNMTLRPGVSLGIWNLSDDLISKTNRITEYALIGALDIPDSRITAHLRLGQNRLAADVGDNADKTFVTGDCYWRPAFLDRFNSAMLFAKLLYNTYDYSTSINNFRESSITAGMSVQF